MTVPAGNGSVTNDPIVCSPVSADTVAERNVAGAICGLVESLLYSDPRSDESFQKKKFISPSSGYSPLAAMHGIIQKSPIRISAANLIMCYFGKWDNKDCCRILAKTRCSAQ